MLAPEMTASVRPSTLLPLLLAACGGPRTSTAAPSSSGTATDAGAPAEAAAPRPFASTALQAQSLIQDQIESQMKPLWKCVDDFRIAKGDPHRAVTIEVGIDQEGNLLGITSADAKHELDPKLKDCMWSALHGLPLPRSHAGVITIRQSFTDTSVTP
jgi:hypothetical protein